MSALNAPGHTTGSRLLAMLWGWGFVGVVYGSSHVLTHFWRADAVHTLVPWAVDSWLPFWPQAVWLYLSFFVFLPVAFMTCRSEHVRPLRRAFQWTAFIAGLCFVLWPTQLVPLLDAEITRQQAADPLTHAALRLLQSWDSDQNCWPSLHCALSVIAALALQPNAHAVPTPTPAPDHRGGGRWHARLWPWVWALGIGLSTVLTRRHHSLDVITGMALGCLVWYGCKAKEGKP